MITFISTGYSSVAHVGLSLVYQKDGVIYRKPISDLRLRSSDTAMGPAARVLLDAFKGKGFLAQVTIDGVDEQLVMPAKTYQAMRSLTVGKGKSFLASAAKAVTKVTGAKRSCCGG